jgi:hypothetical protein
MSFEESLDIMRQALNLWKKAGDHPSERQYLDFVSLAQLAINRAGQPVSGYHSILAQAHFDFFNLPAAWDEAEKTLAIDENDFKAQLIKVFIAFALYGKTAEDTQSKKQGIWGAFNDVINASKQGVRGTAAAGRAGGKLGDALASLFAPGQAKKSLLQELERLIKVFERLCQQGIEASDFVEFSQRLIKLNDGMKEFGISLSSGMTMYDVVANAPIVNVIYESDEQRQSVRTIQLIAHGRKTL